MTPPVEPPASRFAFDLSAARPGEDLVFTGGDFEPATVLAAYRAGLFPMGVGRRGGSPLGWWSPDPRGVLPLSGLRVSRSLRRAVPQFEIRVNTAFEDVVRGCADPARSGRWITPEVLATYLRLHRSGWAHSVECWQAGRLVGGLYGLAIGGLFAGESMFHRERDASKVALVALVDRLAQGEQPAHRLLDVQWCTPHLASLGVVTISRQEYAARLGRALSLPPAQAFEA